MGKTSAYTAKQPDASGHINYSDADNAVWQDLMAQQLPKIGDYCAAPYLDGFARLDLPQNRVPQCGEISDALMPLTGWCVAPVPAVIGFERFFSMLAERVFPAASFIRNRKDFNYIEEPDIFHEIFGHAPLLTDPRFAAFSQAIGAAGLRADRQDYVWLIRLYWFTIEFGLLAENGGVKALGSGLASSPTELCYAVESDVPARRGFDVTDILRTPYRIDIQQPVYFVLDTVEQLFAAAERDLIADISRARGLGLFAPSYPPKNKAS